MQHQTPGSITLNLTHCIQPPGSLHSTTCGLPPPNSILTKLNHLPSKYTLTNIKVFSPNNGSLQCYLHVTLQAIPPLMQIGTKQYCRPLHCSTFLTSDWLTTLKLPQTFYKHTKPCTQPTQGNLPHNFRPLLPTF